MSAGETGLSDELLESLVGRLQQLKLQSSDPLAVQQSITEVRALWQSLGSSLGCVFSAPGGPSPCDAHRVCCRCEQVQDTLMLRTGSGRAKHIINTKVIRSQRALRAMGAEAVELTPAQLEAQKEEKRQNLLRRNKVREGKSRLDATTIVTIK